jgi:hypothetical protein
MNDLLGFQISEDNSEFSAAKFRFAHARKIGFVSQKGARRLSPLLLWRLSKAYAGFANRSRR